MPREVRPSEKPSAFGGDCAVRVCPQGGLKAAPTALFQGEGRFSDAKS